MKKSIIYLASLAAVFTFVTSCEKEQQNPAEEQGRVVRLFVNISKDAESETKFTHTNTGTAVKPAWEIGDQIRVYNNTKKKYEWFTLEKGEGEETATFKNENSTLEEGDVYNVFYPNTSADWSVQDGSLEHLPALLRATGKTSLGAEIKLSPVELRYFNLSVTYTGTEEVTYANAYLRQTGGSFVLKNKSNASTSGLIKIAPEGGFTFNNSDKKTIDLYLAASFSGDITADSPEMELVFTNADYVDGHDNDFVNIQHSTFTWTPTKSYAVGKVYKASATLAAPVEKLVGAADNTSAWWTAHSDYYTIPEGKTVELQFTNYGTSAATLTNEVWHNWVLAVANGLDRGADGYSEYFVLRCDAYGWGDSNTSTSRMNNTSTGATEGDWWEYFRNHMDGTKVTMKMERTQYGTLLVTVYAAVPGSDVVFISRYSHPIPAGEAARFFLATDLSHYQIQGISTYDSTTELTYLTTDAPYYVCNQDLDFATVGYTKLLGHYATWFDDSSIIADVPMDASLLTSTLSGTITATAGLQEICTATYNSKSVPFKVTTIKGVAELGEPDYVYDWWVGGWSPYPYFGEIATGETKTMKFLLYSSCDGNDKHVFTQLCTSGFASNYVTVRMDNWGWDGRWDSATKESNWNWDLFASMQNRATVLITITRTSDTAATIRYDVTWANGETHYQQYGITVDEGVLAYRYASNGSYAVVIE